MNKELRCVKLMQVFPKFAVHMGLILILFLSGYTSVYASANTQNPQPIQITGGITDVNGIPVPGATIIIKGTVKGSISDLEGNYSINVEAVDVILVFSCMGYLSTEISTVGRTEIDIVLEEDIIGIEEVVVVGYGTMKKGVITSSITSVKSKDFVKGSVVNPLQLLKGKVAGLAINTISGNPNSPGIQMMLRGVSTLQGNSQPLVVIDGIAGGSLNLISPDDIESIDVLKDGSAAAIYGTRGTNGVILITTKKGATIEGASTIDYHGYFSFETISNEIEVFSADEYRNIPEKTNDFFQIVDQGYSTNWWDEVSRTPFSQIHNLSVKGGSSNTNYLAAVNYRTQEGLIINTDKEQINYRLGINHAALNNRLRINLNVINTVVKGHTNAVNNIYFATRIANPTEAPVDTLGNYAIFAGVDNAVQMAKEFKEDINWNQLLVNGKITVEPINGLNISLVTALQRFNHLNGWYGNRKFNTSRTGEAGRNASLNQQKTLETMVDYTRQIDAHTFTVLGGYSYQDFTWEGFDLYNYNFPSDAFEYNRPDLGYALPEGLAEMGGYKGMSRLIAFFGRINYSYNNKYMVSASIRREGSTKFGENHKWGLFPAISAGWRISQEKFMANIGFINDLKLRVGYGVTGTEPNSSYLSQMRFDYYEPTYYEGKWIYSVGPSKNPNPNLKWETKHETNIGMDFSLLDFRLSGSVDIYSRNTIDLLYKYNVPVPPNLVSTILANVGEVSNKGIELTLNGRLIQNKDFSWDVSGNFSHNINKLIKLSNEQYKRDFLEVGNTGAPVQKPTHMVEEGEPLGNFFGWKSIGLDSTGAWVIDGSYEELTDRQILGNGIPKIFAGVTTNFRYKNFDFSVSIRGAFQYQILNQYRMLWENFIKGQQYNFPESILEHPYGSTAWVKTAPAYVSYYIENGDYLKIDNVTLGYNFNIKSQEYLRFARIYVALINAYTFTDYKGVDPEINFSGLAPGMDPTGGYPTTRTFTFGVKLSL